jgi:hypothetical protein
MEFLNPNRLEGHEGSLLTVITEATFSYVYDEQDFLPTMHYSGSIPTGPAFRTPRVPLPNGDPAWSRPCGRLGPNWANHTIPRGSVVLFLEYIPPVGEGWNAAILVLYEERKLRLNFPAHMWMNYFTPWPYGGFVTVTR